MQHLLSPQKDDNGTLRNSVVLLVFSPRFNAVSDLAMAQQRGSKSLMDLEKALVIMLSLFLQLFLPHFFVAVNCPYDWELSAGKLLGGQFSGVAKAKKFRE